MIFVAYFEVSQTIATNRNLSFSSVAGQQQPTPQPETIVLAEKAPLGKVTFNHLNHTSRNYNIEGTRPVYCIECHHVEQPGAEAKKLPPHQTSYPPHHNINGGTVGERAGHKRHALPRLSRAQGRKALAMARNSRNQKRELDRHHDDD
jgi:hypothetical protein